MSDSEFGKVYDDIFISDNVSSVVQNNSSIDIDENKFSDMEDKISTLSKFYMEGSTGKEDKMSFLKLKKEYLIIKNINDYKEIQKELYGDKSRRELINFEITRILNHALYDVKVSEQITSVEKLLAMYNGKLSDELYYKMISLIIKIELSLGMKIGLFNELCYLFENELNKIERSYVKTK